MMNNECSKKEINDIIDGAIDKIISVKADVSRVVLLMIKSTPYFDDQVLWTLMDLARLQESLCGLLSSLGDDSDES